MTFDPLSLVRLFAWRLFVFSPGVISPRKDEKTPCEKTKRKNNARRKDEKTPCEKNERQKKKKKKNGTRKDDKVKVSNGIFSHGVISSFRVASFRLFAWRYFSTKRRKDSMRKKRKDEITPGEKTKRPHARKRKDKNIPREKTTKLKFQIASFCAKISSFHMADFVFSHGVISSFRMAFFFRFFAWRFYVFSSFRVASFCRQKTKRRNGTIQPLYKGSFLKLLHNIQ